MTTLPAQIGQDVQGRRRGVVSNEARTLARDLLDAPIPVRREVLRTLDARELGFVFVEVQRETGTMYGLWHDDPAGFVEDICGETTWSKQREVLEAIPHHKRVAVPAGFGVGKSHISGRITAWYLCTRPIGNAQVVTIAPRYRQVRNQLWPHIRRVQARAKLPGSCDMVQWKMTDQYGKEVLAAYGFAVPENDESAMQGVHASGGLLLIVEEAGGLSKAVGEGTNNLLTGDAKLLAIGNPPTDSPNSWFETLCKEGYEGEDPTTTTIKISTRHSPGITGEETPICRECPEGVPPHLIVKHLPDQGWMDNTIKAYGEDHPYVIAKVNADFPKDVGLKILPASWIDAARDIDDPVGEEWVRLCDLGLPDETATHTVKRGSWVRLGVDVASDGGDELAIYRVVGDAIEQRHVSSGAVNANSMDVADRVLAHVHAAEALAKTLGSTAQVRVKIDTIGLGWGLVGTLDRWGREGKHGAKIVPVHVAESPEQDDAAAAMRPRRKRDEMWLALRTLLEPDVKTGEGRVRLRLDDKCAAQLAVPNYGNPGGLVQVESKASMKARGQNSPDRAEAVLMSVYEPIAVGNRRTRGILNSGSD